MWLTADLPGTGGVFKAQEEDFVVEELPAYLPCGTGEHLFLLVEKQGLTTLDLVRRLARQCNIAERDIGYAGMKDARGMTRQWLSLPASAAQGRLSETNDRFRILKTALHRNKLRIGHLRGNRFRILLREVEEQALPHAQAILCELAARGVPNRFGAQRFGALGNTHLIGRALLAGEFEKAAQAMFTTGENIRNPRWKAGAELFAAGNFEKALEVLPETCRTERSVVKALAQGKTPRAALLALPQRLLRLYISAWQSAIFDRVVEARLDTLGQILAGDLAMKHANGACFAVSDPLQEQARADAWEISPTGPLPGAKKMLWATEAAGAIEQKALAGDKDLLESSALPAGLRPLGERRALRVPLGEASAELVSDGLQLTFTLPAGSYATCVVEEVMKSAVAS